MSIPLLIILSDWAYVLLRAVFGSLILVSGLERFRKTKLVGLLDVVAGVFLIAGFLARWVSLVIVVEMVMLIGWKLYAGRRSKEDLALDILLSAVALYIFMKGAGIASIDENLFLLF